MSRYVQVDTPSGLIWVEVEKEDSLVELEEVIATGPRSKIKESFLDALDALKGNAENIIAKMRGLSEKPDEVEVSFSMKVGAEGGNTVFALAKGNIEAGYVVKLTWKKEDHSK